jgi:outer membrane protein assembly factor BamB
MPRHASTAAAKISGAFSFIAQDAQFANMKTRLLIPLLGCLLAAAASAQTPRILWSFDTRDASFGQTAAGDIDGDGRLEVVFGCYRNDSCVYALNGEDGTLLWKVNTHAPGAEGCNDVAPAIFDADGDGSLDVVVPSSCNPTTYCFDGTTGAVKWAARTRGSDSPPTVADIDGDGKPEILHGEFGGWVRCLNAEDGSMAWELAVDTHSWIQTAPTLLDADGDGRLDFIVATWNRTQGDTNTVRAYRCSDRALLWSVPLTNVVYHASAVADLDRDGRPELCFGDYDGVFHVLNAEDGSAKWTVPSAGPGHYIGAPASISDLDGDGSCEVVFISWYQVLAYTAAGVKRWEYSIDQYSTAFRGAALADVDNDALPEVLFGTTAGQLVALKGTNGLQIRSVDLAAAYGNADFALDHAPVIADFNGDDTLDAFIVGGHAEYPAFSNDFGRAYAVSIGKGEGPDWLLFQQNLARSSSLCRQQTSGVRFLPDGAPASVRMYPVPAREYIDIETGGLEGVDLYNSAGRLVLTVRAGADRVRVPLTGLPPGVYFANVRTARYVFLERVLRR